MSDNFTPFSTSTTWTLVPHGSWLPQAVPHINREKATRPAQYIHYGIVPIRHRDAQSRSWPLRSGRPCFDALPHLRPAVAERKHDGGENQIPIFQRDDARGLDSTGIRSNPSSLHHPSFPTLLGVESILITAHPFQGLLESSVPSLFQTCSFRQAHAHSLFS